MERNLLDHTDDIGSNVENAHATTAQGKSQLVKAAKTQRSNSSLARREKISERMKFLQDLVPSCSKFLSMKLATVNPPLDLNIERLGAKDVRENLTAHDHKILPSSALGFHSDMYMPYHLPHPSQPGPIQAGVGLVLYISVSISHPGPRESLIRCFIKRNQSTHTYDLYLSLTQVTTLGHHPFLVWAPLVAAGFLKNCALSEAAQADDVKFLLAAWKCRFAL